MTVNQHSPTARTTWATFRSAIIRIDFYGCEYNCPNRCGTLNRMMYSIYPIIAIPLVSIRFRIKYFFILILIKVKVIISLAIFMSKRNWEKRSHYVNQYVSFTLLFWLAIVLLLFSLADMLFSRILDNFLVDLKNKIWQDLPSCYR